MANTVFGGFHADQCLYQKATRYPIASGYATALAAGDALTLITDGTITTATDGSADLILGVLKEVEYTNALGQRVRSTYYPASTTYSGGSFGRDQTWCWVYDDPNTEYWGCLPATNHASTDTATEVETAVGANMDITTGAPNSVYRRSTHVLNGNPEVATRRFRVVGVRRVPGNRSFTTGSLHVKVRINEGFHPFHSVAGI